MKNGLPAAKSGAAPLDSWLGNLPAQPTRLIGRSEELATARSQLLAPEVHLLTLVGPDTPNVANRLMAPSFADRSPTSRPNRSSMGGIHSAERRECFSAADRSSPTPTTRRKSGARADAPASVLDRTEAT